MSRKKIKKAVNESIDNLLDKYNVDIKLFGHPVKDFELSEMTTSQIRDMRKVLIKKIDSYEG